MTKLIFDRTNPFEVYAVFFNAIKNSEGHIKNIIINNEKRTIFILKKNPFDKKVILDLDSLSIYEVRVFFGKIVSIDKILDIDDTIDNKNKDLFKEKLEELSGKISEEFKNSFLEHLKKKKELKKKQKLQEKIASHKRRMTKQKQQIHRRRRSVAK